MAKKKLLVALVGNQNSGKTSLFNALVGARQKVGNWPGVTVEKFEGKKTYQDHEITFVDLPGIYSLIAYTPEERVTRDFLINAKPDLILNIVDATNLDRNLYLTTQLMELNLPLIVGLNIYDEVKRSGTAIDVKHLAELFGVCLLPLSAKTGQGLDKLLGLIVDVHAECREQSYKLEHYADIEDELTSLGEVIAKDAGLQRKYPARWLALKLLERDAKIYSIVHGRPIWLELEPLVQQSIKRLEKHFEQDFLTTIVESRYAFIRGALKETVVHSKETKSLSQYIDDILVHRVVGLPLFFFFMWLLFHTTFSFGEIPMQRLELSFSFLGNWLNTVLPAGIIRSLVVDGIVAGVGGVLVFVPNILILFAGISILEGTGYMARAAFVVDRFMHKVGLHGRSFIPMIIGFGCTVPAFMACRTLKNRSDRLTTMLILPFISCSAKLPVYILLIGAFFPKELAGTILFGIYMLGVVVALIMAKLLKTVLFKGESEPFVMELPPYRMPSFKNILIHTWEKTVSYLRKAGTVLLFFAILIWVLTNFPQGGIENSLAGQAGKFIEPILRPLGFNWEIGVALIAGFAAKEVVVSTLASIYAQQGLLDTALRASFSPLTALSLMVFVLLYVPCMAATAVFHKEAGSNKMTWFYLLFTTGTAYLMSFLVYQGGRLLGF